MTLTPCLLSLVDDCGLLAADGARCLDTRTELRMMDPLLLDGDDNETVATKPPQQKALKFITNHGAPHPKRYE